MYSDKQSKLAETLRRINGIQQRFGTENGESLIEIRDSIVDIISQSETRIKSALEDRLSDATGHVDEEHDDSEPPIDQTNKLMAVVELLIDQKTKYESDYAFLSSLQFPEMRLRQEAVKDAHSNTFEWIFRDGQEDSPARQFPTWLKEGNGVFWIKGKAGSGKSTLMKYLSQNSHTCDLLKSWAGDKQLPAPRYYFWNAGSKMQKTREGLIQTVLFELLRVCPDVIPVARKSLHHLPTEPRRWAISDLMAVTTSLVTCALSKRFCIFIDGLDEHEGELDELLGLIDRLASSPNIKICCSSRPWPIFADAFGEDQNRMLKLEDLTQKDIEKYVVDSFQRHKRFVKYTRNTRFATLIRVIADRSNCVFLWVTLVVKSLLDGLTNADTIADLERRVATMPSDLEGLYWRMIYSVDPFYKRKSSELLLMIAGSAGDSITDRVPCMAYFINILDGFDDDPSILAHGATSDILGDPNEWRDDMVRKLDARTKGLVELSTSMAEIDESHLEWISRHDIEVLHRSVYDFLRVPKVIEELRRTCAPNFDPLKRLLDASLILLLSPTIPGPTTPWQPTPGRKIECILEYSRRYEKRNSTSPMGHLRVASQHYPLDDWYDVHGPLNAPRIRQTFLSMAVWYGLDLYFAEALRDDPELVRKDLERSFYPVLSMSLRRIGPLSSNTIELILQNGGSISRFEGGLERTAWSIFLEDTYEHVIEIRIEEPWEGNAQLRRFFRSDEEMKDIFASLISHGADLGDKRAEPVIRGLFNHDDAEYLLSLSPSPPQVTETK